jgi:adenine phosphoribosyltransferase
MEASIRLLRKVGADVKGVACIIELTFLDGRTRIDAPCHTLIAYDE